MTSKWRDHGSEIRAVSQLLAFYEGFGFGRPVETAFEIALAGLGARDGEARSYNPSAAMGAQQRRMLPLIDP